MNKDVTTTDLSESELVDLNPLTLPAPAPDTELRLRIDRERAIRMARLEADGDRYHYGGGPDEA